MPWPRILMTALAGAALLFAGSMAPAQNPGTAPKPAVDSAAMRKKLQQQIQENQSPQPEPKANTGDTALASTQGAEAGKGQSFVPEAPDPLLNDPATQQVYLAAMREYYNYRISGYQHRQRVFAWQFLSSKLIFATVLILVFAGIYFAAIQFHKGLSSKKGEAVEAVTDIEASLKGIKVSSPVLGVIILVISFAFFYLYLVYVYPIHEVF